MADQNDKPLICALVHEFPDERTPAHGHFCRDSLEAIGRQADVAAIKQVRRPWSALRIRRPLTETVESGPGYLYLRSGVSTADPEGERCTEDLIPRIRQYFGRTPDLLLAFDSLHTGLMARRLSSRLQRRYAVVERSVYLERHVRNDRSLADRVLGDAAFIAVASPEMADLLVGLGYSESRLVSLPPLLGTAFLDAEFRPPPSLQATSPPTSLKWLYVADDAVVKGPELLARVFAEFQVDPYWELTVVGDGVFDQLDRYGIRDRVTVHPRMPRSRLLDCMQNHHALISTSHIERTARPVLEMLALGRPVLATRSGAPERMLPPESGVLTPLEDHRALTGGVARIRDRYEEYDPDDIRKKTVERYFPEPFATTFTATLSKTLDESNTTIGHDPDPN